MIMFNDILRLEGLDPKTVRLVRHGDARVSLYEAWRKDPQLLEGYQTIQSRNVFKAGDKLASFVVTPHPRRETLFVGLFLVLDVGRAAPGTTDPVLGHDVTGFYEYEITRSDELAEYVGRLTIDWGRAFRTWVQQATARPKPVLSITDQIEPPFPGFDTFWCDIDSLDDMYLSWKEVLRHVKGVYLLVDEETGARYVGSATGDDSLWGRFREYAETGHGGNIELRRLGRRRYRASVLQIGSFDGEILEAESAWKTKLMTRQFGLNAN